MPHSVLFFATPSDLRPSLEWLESVVSVRYFLTDPAPSASLIGYESVGSLPNFGISRAGSVVLDVEFIVLKATRIPAVRFIESGPERGFVPASQENPAALFLRPGGMYSKNILVAGSIGCGDDESVVSLFKKLRSRLVKGWHKSGRYYVGPEAVEQARSGVRLVPMDARQDQRFDIRGLAEDVIP